MDKRFEAALTAIDGPSSRESWRSHCAALCGGTTARRDRRAAPRGRCL